MSLLSNRVNNKELKALLFQEDFTRTTISFYQYFPIIHPQETRDYLYKHLNLLNVFGRIYIAKEGINVQISVPSKNYQALEQFLNNINGLQNVRLNIAVDDDGKSFWVLKIKVRDKIVADGLSNSDFNMEQKGKYVNATEMNTLLKREDTVVIDMRNHYEFEVGHFKNALEVPSDTFREQLPMAVNMMKGQEDKNIVMYCTGGIRCEKASAYMLYSGFKNVFHLEGGIINYAKQVKELGLESEFIGKNFVFDNRLGERITEDIIAKCHQCGMPADTHTNCLNDGCHLLFIQCADCAKKYDGCCSTNCQTTYQLPIEEQKKLREGIDKGSMIFNKSKVKLRPHLVKDNKN